MYPPINSQIPLPTFFRPPFFHHPTVLYTNATPRPVRRCMLHRRPLVTNLGSPRLVRAKDWLRNRRQSRQTCQRTKVCTDHSHETISFIFSAENEGQLRRSVRPLKGKGSLERLQIMSETVSHHGTKKRKGGQLDDLPEETPPNAMAPSQSKAKKHRTDKVNAELHPLNIPVFTLNVRNAPRCRRHLHWFRYPHLLSSQCILSHPVLSQLCNNSLLDLASEFLLRPLLFLPVNLLSTL